MEIAFILAFCAILVACNALGVPLYAGLAVGLVLFWGFALAKHHRVRDIARMTVSGVNTAKGVVIVFVCIGILTGLWRVDGTIAALVSLITGACDPVLWPALSFLSCAGVSFLMGTAFGTCATMGVVCMAIGNAIGVDAVLLGGAIVSGCYFGDRCSPVSGSALLVATLTSTRVADNIPGMLKMAAVPFTLTCALYLALGVAGGQGDAGSLVTASATAGASAATTAAATAASTASATAAGTSAASMAGFAWHPALLLPAAVVLVLPLFKCSARVTLLASSAVAFAVALLVQGTSPLDAAQTAILGFSATGEQSTLFNGGGITSMLVPIVVVLLASTYAGIFRETGLLAGLEDKIVAASARITPFGGHVATAVLTSMISCNQTLAIMLTSEMCGAIQPDDRLRALELADSAVVLAPLVPWSIAATVPLSIIAAPATSLLFAFLLYLIPICHFTGEAIRRHARKRT